MSPSTRALATAALLCWLAAPSACVTQDMLRDLCEDGGACVSAAGCPTEPPNAGQKCDGLQDNDVCFYCTEGDRIDATQFACETGRFQRRANVDCN